MKVLTLSTTDHASPLPSGIADSTTAALTIAPIHIYAAASMMAISHSGVFARIRELTASDKSVGECMGEVIAMCSRDLPHKDWLRLGDIDFEADAVSIAQWVGRVFVMSPAPFPIAAVWFGICNPADTESCWADMHAVGLAQYAAEDESMEWLFDGEQHRPDENYANSVSLRSIYAIAYADPTGLGNDAEWPLCLAFGAFAIRSALARQTPRFVASWARRIGVAVGFDSGDILKIGELTPTGFVAV